MSDEPVSDAPAWTDTHCHVQEGFRGDDEGHRAILDRAARAGVRRAICIGTGLESSRAAVDLARDVASSAGPVSLFASVGLHPHEASVGTAAIGDYLGEVMASQGAQRTPGCVVAVGECGLDYYYEHSPRARQRAAFAEQIELARAHDLTLVVHTRDAFDDTIELLGDAPARQRVVIHCFSGGPEVARRLVAAGCFLSFSGIVTFKHAEPTREAARECPGDRILVETDAPFLAPVPHRGRPNEPAHVSVVGAAVAELRGEPPERFASLTSSNAERAFKLTV